MGADVMCGALPSVDCFELHLSIGGLMQWAERQRPGMARRTRATEDLGDVFEALLAENIELARSLTVRGPACTAEGRGCTR